MLDWLETSLTNGPEVHAGPLFGRLGLAFLLGVAVAAIYRWTHRPGAVPAPSFISTLVLLAVLIAVVTQVIGSNVARAFSLVGALSIVRFRTVVEDTRDTAFVIFAVVVGMAVGAEQLLVALAGLTVGGAAAVIVRPRGRVGQTATAEWSLSVRVGLGSPTEQVEESLRRHFDEVEPLALATARQGAAIDLTYRVRPLPGKSPSAIINELNHLEGVQGVELRRL
jgi:hypothetical protein